VTALYAAEAAAGTVIASLPGTPTWAPSMGPILSGRIDQVLGISSTLTPIFVTAALVDGGAADRIAVVAQAHGPGKAERTVRITVGRAADPADHVSVRIVAWEEIR
jgi:hypothetical protein